jgi:hypothetical protein
MTVSTAELSSWNDGPTKFAITDFVARVTKEGGPDYVEPAARVAVFDSSALGITYSSEGGQSALLYKGAMDFFDDGPEKPVRIWSRIGRRPILAFGNSNGDVPMLAFSGTPSTPSLRLLLVHDDADREFDYTAGAE